MLLALLWIHEIKKRSKLFKNGMHPYILNRKQIKPNWARKTSTTIQKFIQWLRKGQKNWFSEIGIFWEF